MIPRRKDFFDSIFDDSMLTRKEVKVMKTDIEEKDGNYIFTIDVPGFAKENINIELENGYLTVSAKITNSIEENKKYIYQERYTGECSRSFYVGDDVQEEDVKAKFNDGILNITIPVEKETKRETKKYIQID